MSPKSKRPVSVWIAQIILGIYASGTGLGILWGFYKGLTEGISDPQLYFVITIGLLAMTTIFFGGVWGMAIRKPWGRWLGVAGLAASLRVSSPTVREGSTLGRVEPLLTCGLPTHGPFDRGSNNPNVAMDLRDR